MDTVSEKSQIEDVLDKILPGKDLNLVTLKSVRKDVADFLNVEESYFSENKEKKELLKTILKEKILILYNEQQNEEKKKKKKNFQSDISEKKEKSKADLQKSESKNNNLKKKRKIIESEEETNINSDDEEEEEEYQRKKQKKQKNSNVSTLSLLEKKKKKKRDSESSNNNDYNEEYDEDDDEQEEEEEEEEEESLSKKKSKKKNSTTSPKVKNVHTIKKEKLRKIVLDLKIGPTIFKDLNKEDDEDYNKKLEERIIQYCEKKGICSEKNKLPTPTEVYEYKKSIKLKEELDGIDPSNIIDTTTRPRRRNPNPYISQSFSFKINFKLF
ncbi:hypothetical protein PFMG_01408 [Plasmodium falciparum IGH-CR14]|uniref:Histone chaperone domain-containing protein n=1 Tax=Plasmodium falciparum IGH-CR14 TaxID=580059 RepID=A0A0L1I688_PLAFA|nr:hypothetical protein PFMG_01408 [Plasmodium falciparum IGH-CR14]